MVSLSRRVLRWSCFGGRHGLSERRVRFRLSDKSPVYFRDGFHFDEYRVYQALTGKIASGISFPPCSAPNAEPSTVLDLLAAPIVTWIWCKNFLNRLHACGRQNVNGLQHLPQSNLCTGMVARLLTGGPYTNTKRARGPGLQSPSMSSIGL